MKQELINNLKRELLSEFSGEELQSIKQDLLAIIKGKEDFIFFAEYWLGIKLNSFQKRLLRETFDSPQNIWATSNQCGKTVAIAVLHIWFNFYKIGIRGIEKPEIFEKTYYSTLNISPILRQSKECFRYIQQILNSSFTWEEETKRKVNQCKIENFIASVNQNLGEIRFSNNSVHYSLSTGEDQGAGLAGAQFAYISYDECIQSLNFEQELPARIFSRLAKYGQRLDLVGTPDERSKSQQYYFHLVKEAEANRNGFKILFGKYDENEFINEEQREKFKAQLLRLDPIRYRQVVLGEFISTGEKMFEPQIVHQIWNGKISFTLPEKDCSYLISVDWGLSEMGDKTIFAVVKELELLKERHYEIVNARAEKGGDPWKLMAELRLLKQSYNNADVIMDVNSLGGTIFKKMLKDIKPISFDSHGKSKEEALTYLKLVLTSSRDCFIDESGRVVEKNPNFGRLRSYYLSELEAELGNYQLKDDKIKQDWVSALYQAIWWLEYRKPLSQIKVFSLSRFKQPAQQKVWRSSIRSQ